MNNEYIFAHLTVIILVSAISGILLARLNQPIMIGYILDGIYFCPSGFGLIASETQIQFYSELGILLLLFVIGIELNVRSFVKMWRIPTLFTLIQVLANAGIAVLVSTVFGANLGVSLLIAFIISLSSTAAIIKVLEYIGELKTDVGHISIGILVAQDIAIVPMMLIIRESGKFNMEVVIDLVVAIGLVILLIKYLSKKDKINLPTNKILPNSDLTPVVTLALCFLAAAIVVMFGLSEAYGAFLAGLFLGNTQERHNILNSIKPIQNVLLMAFFISVGLMFDLHLTEQNIDEFGRFTRLKQSVDKNKAKTYFEKVKGETLSLFKVNIEVHSFLKDVLLTGNIDIQDIEFTREVTLYPEIDFEPRLVAEDIFVYGSVPVDLPNTNREDLINDKLDLVLMYAIGSSARNKTESAGKIALGIKEDSLGEEQLAAYVNVKYLLFHYWNNPKIFVLNVSPKLVKREDVPTDYLLRQEKDAERFLLLEYNPDVIANIGEYNILKTQRRGNIRYLPFVTTLESIKED